MGVAVGGNGVEVGGISVGEAKTAGKFGAPPEQAVRTNIIKMTKIRFNVDILSIIPDIAFRTKREAGCGRQTASIIAPSPFLER
jgi:hypothetical protein